MIKKPLKILFPKIDEICKKLEINLSDRPQKLSPEIYYRICNEYEDLVE